MKGNAAIGAAPPGVRAEIAGLRGLSPAQVDGARREHGPNVLTPPPRTPWWRELLSKFDDPVIRILLVAASLSAVVGAFGGGHPAEAVGVLIAVLLATTLAFLNEHRAAREFDILNRVTDDAPVRVLRDGAFAAVPRRDVVVGDVVLVETGDEIPADGAIVESVSLQVDESRLTGESLPVAKGRGEPAGGDGAYPPDLLLRSTIVADGHAALEVTATGDRTEIGRTARAAAEEHEERTPLALQLEGLSRLIGVVAFAAAGVAFAGLVIRAVVRGALALEPHQWWFQGALACGTAVALHRVWLPVVFDALEIAGVRRERPAWLEEGGLRAWAAALGGGALALAVLLGALVAAGALPADPALWLRLEQGRVFLEFFLVAVAIIVVAVPEGLAMSVTLSLAYSMRKMTASNALVRRMHACETIGAATVILSDKTGTLTLNRMRVEEACLAGLDGGGDAGRRLRETAAGRLVAAGVAANGTADLATEGDGASPAEPRVLGSPTEGALLLWLREAGVEYLEPRRAHAVEGRLAFSNQSKIMASLLGPDRTLHVKGAPEIVLERCARRITDDGGAVPLEPADRAAIRARLEAVQSRGRRTIGLACRRLAEDEPAGRLDEAARDLGWLGFFAIADPVRPEVPGAIERCRAAGIDVKIVTGDTSPTALEIARQIGLPGTDRPGATMLGPEFAALSDDEARGRLRDLRVLARARPTDKLRLTRLLHHAGEVVAVTGDGSNDAPALNHADVGLAMGRAGTAVAKEAADIVLLDDSFPSIVNAVKWGRSLYANIQRFIVFQLTINVAACVVAVLGPYIGVGLPFTVTQMLWVNLIMDTFAALALATEPPRESVLREPPRRPDRFIITPEMAARILGVGAAFIVVMIALLKTSFLGGDDERHRLTLFFNFFVLLQLWNLFNVRALGGDASAFSGLLGNRPFLAIVAAIALGQALIVQLGGEVFRTRPLGALDWLKTAGLAALVLVAGEAHRAVRRALRKRRGGDP